MWHSSSFTAAAPKSKAPTCLRGMLFLTTHDSRQKSYNRVEGTVIRHSVNGTNGKNGRLRTLHLYSAFMRSSFILRAVCRFRTALRRPKWDA